MQRLDDLNHAKVGSNLNRSVIPFTNMRVDLTNKLKQPFNFTTLSGVVGGIFVHD